MWDVSEVKRKIFLSKTKDLSIFLTFDTFRCIVYLKEILFPWKLLLYCLIKTNNIIYFLTILMIAIIQVILKIS